MVLTTFACMPIFWTKGRITRMEGFILLNIYIFYILDKIFIVSKLDFLEEFRLFTIWYAILLGAFLVIKESFKNIETQN